MTLVLMDLPCLGLTRLGDTTAAPRPDGGRRAGPRPMTPLMSFTLDGDSWDLSDNSPDPGRPGKLYHMTCPL